MKKRTLLLLVAVIVLSCVLCCIFGAINRSSPTYKATATARAIAKATEAAKPTDTPALPPTDTPTPSPPLAKVTAPALNVRAGPGTDYPIVGKLSLDDSVEAVGRNAAGDWLQIVYPANSDRRGWIAADYAKLTGPLETLPEVSAPSPPTPKPTGTPAEKRIIVPTGKLSELEEYPTDKEVFVQKKDGTTDERANDLEELCKDWLFYRKKIFEYTASGNTDKAEEYRTLFQEVNMWLDEYDDSDIATMVDILEQQGYPP